MKKILITGSSGYIGQHLCKMLQGKYDIDGVDLKSGKSIFDLSYPTAIEYDTVIHLAAYVKVNESVDFPYLYYHNNIEGTKSVLRNTRFNNFIFASTGAAENPISPYALSKRAAEDVVKEDCNIYDKDYTIFRFYNVTGTDGFPPTNPDGLLHNLIKAKDTGSFNLYGTKYDTPDGTAIRDYVHVNEVCSAIEMAIEKPANQMENLGHGEGTSVKRIIEIFKRVNGCDFEVIPMPARLGDLPKSVLKNVSLYIRKSYTIEELLRIKP